MQLYDALLRFVPTPVVALNAAVALAMASGPALGLQWINALEGDLLEYHLFFAARADLLRRLGRTAEARVQYEGALALVVNPAERAYLERRLRELGSGPP